MKRETKEMIGLTETFQAIFCPTTEYFGTLDCYYEAFLPPSSVASYSDDTSFASFNGTNL
jgi:hypothetical protein